MNGSSLKMVESSGNTCFLKELLRDMLLGIMFLLFLLFFTVLPKLPLATSKQKHRVVSCP